MTETVFVDTNIFVYSRDQTEPEKLSAAREWVDRLWKIRRGRTSYQVLQEYYVTVTRKLANPLPVEEARQDVVDLIAWRPVQTNQAVLTDAWTLQDRYRFSWWDALIVAAARQADCRYLLSEDFQAGQTIDELKIVNPFETGVSDLIE